MKHKTEGVNRTVHDVHGRFVALHHASAQHHRHIVETTQQAYTDRTADTTPPSTEEKP